MNKIDFKVVEEDEGVTAIMGYCSLPDGRRAACIDRFHGKYSVSPLPGARFWVKYDNYDELEANVRRLISEKIDAIIGTGRTDQSVNSSAT